ncbi:hypothetical protein M9458_022097, partial [Cirrhinus mrigala]
RGSVRKGMVQVRGGVRRPHALPSEVRGARGGGFIHLGLRHFLEIKRPGILACSRLTAGPAARHFGVARSLNSPFLDPRGHQRACTGKRPVSRGEARSFQQRR